MFANMVRACMQDNCTVIDNKLMLKECVYINLRLKISRTLCRQPIQRSLSHLFHKSRLSVLSNTNVVNYAMFNSNWTLIPLSECWINTVNVTVHKHRLRLTEAMGGPGWHPHLLVWLIVLANHDKQWCSGRATPISYAGPKHLMSLWQHPWGQVRDYSVCVGRASGYVTHVTVFICGRF